MHSSSCSTQKDHIHPCESLSVESTVELTVQFQLRHVSSYPFKIAHPVQHNSSTTTALKRVPKSEKKISKKGPTFFPDSFGFCMRNINQPSSHVATFCTTSPWSRGETKKLLPIVFMLRDDVRLCGLACYDVMCLQLHTRHSRLGWHRAAPHHTIIDHRVPLRRR